MRKVKTGPAESAEGILERGQSPQPDHHLSKVSVVAKAGGTREVSAENEKTNSLTGSQVNISRDHFHGEWNYSIKPNSS